MIATIVLCLVLAAIVFWNVRTIVRNVRAGKDIGGCGGDCTKCHCCQHSVKTK